MPRFSASRSACTPRTGPSGMREDACPSHQHVGAGRGGDRAGRQVHAAVHLQLAPRRPLLDQRPRAAQLRHHLVDELLPTEARVHRHQRSRSRLSTTSSTVVSDVPGLSPTPTCLPACLHLLNGAVQVGSRLLMEDQQIAPGLDEGIGVALGPLDHEVNLERQLRPSPHRLHHRDAERQVGHEQPVHDVDVEAVRAAPLGIGDLLSEPQVVRREDGGEDLHDSGST